MDIEYRTINDEEMPPIVFAIDDNDRPKIIINMHYQIWLSLYRAEIGGCAKSLYDEIIKLLDAHLSEQREVEKYEI
tara:strand:+ start:3052 stop:3279 length:228 start_codon:yes stop_codon:yes gene_type:complete